MSSKTLSPIHVFIDWANFVRALDRIQRTSRQWWYNLDLSIPQNVGKLAVILYSIEKYIMKHKRGNTRGLKILFYIITPYSGDACMRGISPNQKEFDGDSDLLNLLSRVQIWWPGDTDIGRKLKNDVLTADEQREFWRDIGCIPQPPPTRPEQQAIHACESPDDLLLLWLIGKLGTYEDIYIITGDKLVSERRFIECISSQEKLKWTLKYYAEKCGNYLDDNLPCRLLPSQSKTRIGKFEWMEINQEMLFEPFSKQTGMTSVGAGADDFMKFIGFAVPDLGPPAAAATSRRAIIDPTEFVWVKRNRRTMCEEVFLNMTSTEGQRYFRDNCRKKITELETIPPPFGEPREFREFAGGESHRAWESAYPVREEFSSENDPGHISEMFEMAAGLEGGSKMDEMEAFGMQPESELEPEPDRVIPDNWEDESDESDEGGKINKKKKKKKNKSRKKTRKAKRRTKKSKKKTKKKKK